MLFDLFADGGLLFADRIRDRFLCGAVFDADLDDPAFFASQMFEFIVCCHHDHHILPFCRQRSDIVTICRTYCKSNFLQD